MVVSRSAMMPETALAAVMHAWVPLFPAWRADNTRDTCPREGTKVDAGAAHQRKDGKGGGHTLGSPHLFADRPGAFDQLSLGVGIGWTYLQGPGFLDQEDAAVSKFLNPCSDLEPYLWSQKEGRRKNR